MCSKKAQRCDTCFRFFLWSSIPLQGHSYLSLSRKIEMKTSEWIIVSKFLQIFFFFFFLFAVLHVKMKLVASSHHDFIVCLTCLTCYSCTVYTGQGYTGQFIRCFIVFRFLFFSLSPRDASSEATRREPRENQKKNKNKKTPAYRLYKNNAQFKIHALLIDLGSVVKSDGDSPDGLYLWTMILRDIWNMKTD